MLFQLIIQLYSRLIQSSFLRDFITSVIYYGSCLRMDFFNDDFGFGDSPYLKPNKNVSKNLNANKSGKGKDDFDDLLDEMLDKEKKKITKQKNSDAPSFNSMTSIDRVPSPTKLQNATKKQEGFDSYNITLLKNQSEFNKPYEPLRNRPSSRSIHDDKGSEDNKSYKSGATGFAGFDNPDTLKIPTSYQEIPQFSNSTRMMKPPLRKRADSKMGSEMGEDDLRGADLNPLLNQIESPSLMRPPLPKKDPSPPKPSTQPNFLSVRNIELTDNKPAGKEEAPKVLYVKQENKEIRQQFDKQLKLIKQSHDKQIAYLRQELQKQTKNGREMKLKLLGEFEDQKSKDRKLYEMIAQKDAEKMQSLYEWEIRRKSEAYQLQIQKLKNLIEISYKSQPQSSNFSYESERQALHIRQKQLQGKQRRSEQQEVFLKQRQKMIESREAEFDLYRKREEEKLHNEKKELLKLQSDLRKKKMELRKEIEDQKISMASSVSKEQFQIARRKEQIKIDREELEIERQLFEKQKMEYLEFNDSIMKDFKQKLKQLESDRNHLKDRQIELYKKIQTVQMMGNLKAGKKLDETKKPNQENMSQNQGVEQEGAAKVKKDLGTRQESPGYVENKMREQHEGLEENLRRSSLLNANKTNLKQYLLKVNRNNQRMRPFLA